MTFTHDLRLTGCRTRPLASYLAGLGVFRLVAEQTDERAHAYWDRDAFHLVSALDREGLLGFLLRDYEPTPIVAPWNGGSGFNPKDKQDGILAIQGGAAPRLASYRATIEAVYDLRHRLGLDDKVDTSFKEAYLSRNRAALPDEALIWLDAAVQLTGDGVNYPPLLGTGGNDGRLEFTNNFMQRLTDCFDAHNGEPTPLSRAWLGSSLFDEPVDELTTAAVGQFSPGSAGGANEASGFEGSSLTNPWDFILMLEGAVLFASATTRRLEQTEPGALSYPFTVQPSSAGYASAATGDEEAARAEMWLPLWPAPARLSELRALLAEGRARLGRRPAKTGVDFARAVAGLGVDRGLSAFERYGFQLRNGRSYLATPLGRFRVQRKPEVELLTEIDPWLDRLRAAQRSGPASVRQASRQLDEALLALCRQVDSRRVQAVIIGLGRVELALATSLKWTSEKHLRPLPELSPKWLRYADDGSTELRLAASLASIRARFLGAEGRRRTLSLRTHLEPVRLRHHRYPQWLPEGAGALDVIGAADLVTTLNRILARRLLHSQKSYSSRVEVAGGLGPARIAGWAPAAGRLPAELADVADFVDGRVNDRRIGDLLPGLAAIRWSEVRAGGLQAPYGEAFPSAAFALPRLALSGLRLGDSYIPPVPEIHSRAARGDGVGASRLAARRLTGSGMRPAVSVVHLCGDAMRRVAAALLFPLAPADLDALKRRCVRPEPVEGPSTEGAQRASSQP